MRRSIQVTGWTLIWSGVFIFGYLGWQLFGTGLVNAGVQQAAKDSLRQVFEETLPPEVEQVDAGEFLAPDTTPDPEIPELVEFHPETGPATGEELAFLSIPKIGVEEVLFEGVDRETLKNGPGHMEGTPIPGQPGNSVLSGHRTTYGSPFFDFDLLENGDRIEVETSIGTHVYEIREIIIVEPTDVWVTDSRPGGWLTLTTCNPKFSARQRLVVFAEMISGPNLAFVELHKQKFS